MVNFMIRDTWIQSLTTPLTGELLKLNFSLPLFLTHPHHQPHGQKVIDQIKFKIQNTF